MLVDVAQGVIATSWAQAFAFYAKRGEIRYLVYLYGSGADRLPAVGY